MEYRALRGQTTIEYLLVFMIVLTFFQFSLNTRITDGGNTGIDIKDAAQSALAAERLYNSIERVHSGGDGGKEAVWVFIPEGGVLHCRGEGDASGLPQAIWLEVEMSREVFEGTCENADTPPIDQRGISPICWRELFMPPHITITCGGGARVLEGSRTPKARLEVLRREVENDVLINRIE